MLDKILFQCWWVKVKKSRGLITIKTGVGILEQSRNYVHFTDATETNFEFVFKVKRLEIIDYVTE